MPQQADVSCSGLFREEEEEEDVVVEGIEERDGEGREVVPGEVKEENKEENKGKEEEGRERV